MDAETLLEDYLKQLGDKMPSFVNFKKWIILEKKLKISDVTNLQGVRGNLNIFHEDWLQQKAAAGDRHSGVFASMLDRQQIRAEKEEYFKDQVVIKINNDSNNKILEEDDDEQK